VPILLNPAWISYINPAPVSYQLFAGTIGPVTATANAAPVTVGTGFTVGAPRCFLRGFWLWACPGGGQSLSAQTFALWTETGAASGALVAGSALTSGALLGGEWNCAAYSSPIPLTQGVPYRAVTGFTGPYPSTLNQWNAGGPYAAGLTNGPLAAYSDPAGSAPDLYGSPQSSLSTAGSDPTVFYPGTGNSGFNAWLDVEILTH